MQVNVQLIAFYFICLRCLKLLVFNERMEQKMIIGYGRAVFLDQNLEQQCIALQEAGCEKKFTDSGELSSKKSALAAALSQLQTGDTLVVPALDRLGRTMKELVQLIHALTSKGIHFMSIDEGIDTTAENDSFQKTITALAAMDEALLKEHTRISMATARQRGSKCGRKRQMTKVKCEAAKVLFKQGMSPKEIASYFDVSIPTLYRWCPASDRV